MKKVHDLLKEYEKWKKSPDRTAKFEDVFGASRSPEEILKIIIETAGAKAFMLDRIEGEGKKLDFYAALGSAVRKQREKFRAKGIDGAVKKANEYRQVWLRTAETLRKKHPNKDKYSTRRIAQEVYRSIKPEQSLQTVYKYLLKKGM